MLMLKRTYRLRNSARIQEVRSSHPSWSNRWLVLVKSVSNQAHSRFAFVVNRKIGKAVVRNRIKRWMREAIRRRLPGIASGWDVVLIARQPTQDAQFSEMDCAMADLLSRSHLHIEVGQNQVTLEDTQI